MEGEGFEPPNPKERIYSPPRLASSLPFQTLYSINGWNNQWELTGSNRWPSACKADALPAELNSQTWPLAYLPGGNPQVLPP